MFVILAFLLDIVVNFRTSFVNKHGDEIFEPKLIAQRYIVGGRFFIDVLATFPFDYIEGVGNAVQLRGDAARRMPWAEILCAALLEKRSCLQSDSASNGLM